jgi:hypothetical protein
MLTLLAGVALGSLFLHLGPTSGPHGGAMSRPATEVISVGHRRHAGYARGSPRPCSVVLGAGVMALQCTHVTRIVTASCVCDSFRRGLPLQARAEPAGRAGTANQKTHTNMMGPARSTTERGVLRAVSAAHRVVVDFRSTRKLDSSAAGRGSGRVAPRGKPIRIRAAWCASDRRRRPLAVSAPTPMRPTALPIA